MQIKPALVLQARLVRRLARRTLQMVRHRRLSLAGVPILFANSFPKSGTHLLTQILEGFTALGPAVNAGLPAVVTFEGSSGLQRPLGEILRDLRRLGPGDIAYGHLHAFPEVLDFLCRDGVAPFFILRDPRDVVVSHVHYVSEMEPDHVHHAYYAGTLKTFDERLRTSILGRPEIDVSFPDIAERFRPFFGWLDRPEALTLHYEDFILKTDEALGRVVDHATGRGFPSRCGRVEAVEVLKAFINPTKSPTFRAGRVNGWRENFSPEMRDLFKSVAGELLIRLGYEKDMSW